MELISKDEVIKIIKSGCKLNSVINVLVKDMVEKVNKETVIDVDEEIMRCKVCRRRCLPTRNDAEDVWLWDKDGGLICGRCDAERRQL